MPCAVITSPLKSLPNSLNSYLTIIQQINLNFHHHDVFTLTYLLFAHYLSHVVISVPLQCDMHAPCQEGTEALSPRARQDDVDTARG